MGSRLLKVEGLAFALTLGLYLRTMAPTLTWAHFGADGGDLAVAVARGRLPHPPGFPTYLIVGSLWIRLLGGDPAWRLNFLSAVAAAGAVAVTVAASRALGARPLLALAAGLILGTASLFWSQALITEVYTLAALGSASVLWMAAKGVSAPLLGLAWGLSLGIHPVLAYLAPVVAWGGSRDLGWRGSALALGTGIAVAVLLYGPGLHGLQRSPSPWAELSGWKGWWDYVSARLYWGYLFGLPPGLWPRRLLAAAGWLARDLALVGAPACLWGWLGWWRERPPMAVAIGSAGLGVLAHAIGYATADSIIYLVPALPILTAAMAAGLERGLPPLRMQGKRLDPTWTILALPALQAWVGWSGVDLHADCRALRWAREILREAPASAVLLTAQDGATFALWYVQEVLGERPDVLILDRDLWAHAPYRRMLARQWGVPPELDLERALQELDRPIRWARASPPDGP
jgi:hypothetical protein